MNFHHRPFRRRSWIVTASVVALASLNACGKDTSSSNNNAVTTTAAGRSATTVAGGTGTTTVRTSDEQTMTITTTEEGDRYLFELPPELETGYVSVTLKNEGKLSHQANIARPVEGKTMAEVEAALAGPIPDSALGMLEWVGGPTAVEGGQSQTVVINFDKPGDYIALCFLQQPAPLSDGKPHIAHGMVQTFKVKQGNSMGQPPKTEGAITFSDFKYELPESFNGQGWYKVQNQGPQPHEMGILKVADGKSTQDVISYLSAAPGEAPAGPPPFTEVGGIGAISKGVDAWLQIDLEPGTYVFLCFIPDAPPSGDGKPHFAPPHGMFTEYKQT